MKTVNTINRGLTDSQFEAISSAKEGDFLIVIDHGRCFKAKVKNVRYSKKGFPQVFFWADLEDGAGYALHMRWGSHFKPYSQRKMKAERAERAAQETSKQETSRAKLSASDALSLIQLGYSVEEIRAMM